MASFVRRHRFIDGVGDVRIHDDIVRMDLLAMSPTQRDEDEQVIPEFSGQLVMSPTAFARMAKVLGMALSSMQEKGMISLEGLTQLTNGTAEADNNQSNDDTPPVPRKRAGGSPNFS